MIKRITFHSEETGFCVLKVQSDDHDDLVTIVGSVPRIRVGEQIECEGVWVTDKRFGLQFKASQLIIAQPTTISGIEKYLSSGMVKGIGPHFAKKLVKAFGERVFEVIENEPDRLLELPV